MDRGTWWVSPWGCKESNMTEHAHKKSQIPQSNSLIITAYLRILVSLEPLSGVFLSIRHSLHASPPLPIQLSSIPHHFNHSFAKTLNYLLLFIASAWCYE